MQQDILSPVGVSPIQNDPTVIIHAPYTRPNIVTALEERLSDLGYQSFRAQSQDAVDKALNIPEASYVVIDDDDIRKSRLQMDALKLLVEERAGLPSAQEMPPMPVQERQFYPDIHTAGHAAEEAKSASHDYGEKVLFIHTSSHEGIMRALAEHTSDYVPYVHMAHGMEEAKKLIKAAGDDAPYDAIILDEDHAIPGKSQNFRQLVKALKEEKALSKTGVIMYTDHSLEREVTLPISMLFDLAECVIRNHSMNSSFDLLTDTLHEVVETQKRRHSVSLEKPLSRLESVESAHRSLSGMAI